jgi:hypothetical protein
MFRSFVAGSFFVLTLSLSVFADGAASDRPVTAPVQTPACSAPAPILNEPTQVGDIDKYAKCVYNCLRRGGGADYCAQSCAGLLQGLQEEKRNPRGEELAVSLSAE